MKLSAGHAWAYVGMTIGAAGSVAANVAHSYIAPKGSPADWSPELGLILAAGFWPIALLIAVEVLIRSEWSDSPLSLTLRYGGVTAVAVVAAVVSYQHLSSLLRHYGETDTAVLVGPIGLDGLMLVCTAALLSSRADPIPTDQPTQPGSAQDQEPHDTAPVTADPAELLTPETFAGSASEPDRDDSIWLDQDDFDRLMAGRGGDPIDSAESGQSEPPRLPSRSPDSRPVGSSRSAQKPDRSRPTPDGNRVAGPDHELVAALERAIKVDRIKVPLTERSVTSVVVAGAVKARELRDLINGQYKDATDGDSEEESLSG